MVTSTEDSSSLEKDVSGSPWYVEAQEPKGTRPLMPWRAGHPAIPAMAKKRPRCVSTPAAF